MIACFDAENWLRLYIFFFPYDWKQLIIAYKPYQLKCIFLGFDYSVSIVTEKKKKNRSFDFCCCIVKILRTIEMYLLQFMQHLTTFNSILWLTIFDRINNCVFDAFHICFQVEWMESNVHDLLLCVEIFDFCCCCCRCCCCYYCCFFGISWQIYRWQLDLCKSPLNHSFPFEISISRRSMIPTVCLSLWKI